MKKITLSAVAFLMLGGVAFAENNNVVNSDLLKKVDGYVRLGYQHDDKDSKTDLAIGGKLHAETKSFSGISAGVSFYTTNAIRNNHDGGSVPFFDADNKSYSILGEAYLLGKFKNTTIKIGRQELDTPFADTDDNGMIPNTFEAEILTNTDLLGTTIVLGQIQRWAGVDTDEPSKFTKLIDKHNVQVGGITYEGIENLALSAWYYNLKDNDIDRIFYTDANYEGEKDDFSYSLGVQYANQHYNASNEDSAKVYGFSASAGYKGFTLGVAYNKSNDNGADNGFGGGPFFTSANFLTIAEAGKDGDAVLVNGEWDASDVIKGLSLNTGYVTLHDKDDTKSTEFDAGLSYAFNDNLSLDVIYSDVDDKINDDKFKNTRVFVNYAF
ncbi:MULTISPECIES: OprD family outer membrane porin [unclassified Lebetimonas]|uniref:OprD family outer membrane porin n=1 Tax=unclassified Lebetimonas TaxID=2648158 RepID=UPI000467BF91|nr:MULTISPECIES: OprD family outer membrane porin [unclassified Lebetimonas]